MRAHLEFLTDENVAQGMTPEQARAAAKRNFGNPDRGPRTRPRRLALPRARKFSRRRALRPARHSPFARLRARRRRHSRPRHRRQHRHFQRRLLGPPAPAPLSPRRAPGLARRIEREGVGHQRHLDQFSALARRIPRLRRHGRIPNRGPHPHRPRPSRSHARRRRDARLLPSNRFASDVRPSVHRSRRPSRRSSHRRRDTRSSGPGRSAPIRASSPRRWRSTANPIKS